MYFDQRIKTQVIASVVAQITSSRKDEDINRDNLRDAINCFVAIGLTSGKTDAEKIKPMKAGDYFVWQGKKNLDQCYRPDFEEPFLAQTQQWFTNMSNIRIKELDCLTYL